MRPAVAPLAAATSVVAEQGLVPAVRTRDGVAAHVLEHANHFNLIRLIAALQVLTVHALNHFEIRGPLVSALKVMPGVPTFFFISGLLICAAYERTRTKGLKAFFINRALRIYPALWASVAVTTLAVVATGYLGSREFSGLHFVAWLLGQSSFFQFYNPDFMRGFGVGVVNGALWTISVELQFYLLTPLLYLLLLRHRGWLVLLFLGSLALNVYLRLYLDWSRLGMKLTYVSFLPWIYIYLLGFVAAHRLDRVRQVLARIPLVWLLSAYVLSMLLVGAYETNASNAINPVSIVLLAACLIKLSTARLPMPQALLRFVARNDFSYGLYLIHMPVINLLLFLGWFSAYGNFLTALAVSATAAALSWYLIEKPALLHKR
jgi:peptidoglycan/LPS O-acetylase OafA/YrhL